ncbi:MAG: hypothetical protein QOD24_3604 [Solirubrobacteraceae bacterium]|jgi:hypothetical protein|nr:hypothetical protein [Solirubrobacteraceae bacterium]
MRTHGHAGEMGMSAIQLSDHTVAPRPSTAQPTIPRGLSEENHSLKTELAIAYGHQRDIRSG